MALFLKNSHIESHLLEEQEERDLNIIDEEFSDSEEEIITQSDHDSESEIECDNHEMVLSDCVDMSEHFMGQDNSTKWMKTSQHEQKPYTEAKTGAKLFSGPKKRAQSVELEVEAFNKIISVEMIDRIIYFTNLYIERKREEVNYSRERDGRLTNRSEIFAVLGVLYLIGINGGSHKRIFNLWTNDGTGMPILRACMSYKRFVFLLRCIRFDDKETRGNRRKTDRLAAIREFLDKFVANCMESYNLGEFVTIDEKLEAFRGRCCFIQHIPRKPTKYGIKVFALCDAKTFYTSQLEVYCGKQPDGPYCVSNKPFDIVQRLTEHIKGTYRNITLDNWYTSYPLALYLLEKKITCIGTLKKDKKEIPYEFLSNKKRDVGSSLFGFQKNITMVSYTPKENKAVVLISTKHDEATIDEETKKPHIILDYNFSKGSVDTVDKMCSKYSVSLTTLRWSMALWYSLLNVTGINAQILFHANTQNLKYPRRVFLKNLSMQLLKAQLTQRAMISSLPVDIRGFLSPYRMQKIEFTEPHMHSQTIKKRGRCATCGRAKNVNTTIICSICSDFVCKKHCETKIICVKCEEVSDVESE